NNLVLVCFYFSSRRRHTRFSRDWSSDVCSSDLSRIIELNHMLHRLCGPPSIPLSFILANVLPRSDTYHFRLSTEDCSPTDSIHRLRRGLPGYLILFAPARLVRLRQLRLTNLPPQLVFRVISMLFTATLLVPATATSLKTWVINGCSPVTLPAFTPALQARLRTL